MRGDMSRYEDRIAEFMVMVFLILFAIWATGALIGKW